MHLKDEMLSGCSDEPQRPLFRNGPTSPAAGSAAEDGPPCQSSLEKRRKLLSPMSHILLRRILLPMTEQWLGYLTVTYYCSEKPSQHQNSWDQLRPCWEHSTAQLLTLLNPMSFLFLSTTVLPKVLLNKVLNAKSQLKVQFLVNLA